MLLLSDKCVRIELKLISAQIVMLELFFMSSNNKRVIQYLNNNKEELFVFM